MKRIFISICVALVIYGFKSYLSGRRHHPEVEAFNSEAGYKNRLVDDTATSTGNGLPRGDDKNFVLKKIDCLLTNIDSVVQDDF